MDRVLVENWNSIVTDQDIVYHLGDFSFGPATKYMKLLNGTKCFVRGNHEKPLLNLINIKDVPYIRHLQIESYPSITLCHFSMRVWHKSHFGAYHLFGHSHGRLEPYKRSVDVGVDSHWITGKQEFRPFSCEEVCDYLEKRQGEKLEDVYGERDEE